MDKWSIGRGVVAIGLVLLEGCALVPSAPSPVPQTAVAVADRRARAAQEAREMRDALERWHETVALWHLSRVSETRQEAYRRQLTVYVNVRGRISAGEGRAIELASTEAAFADDEIQLRRDDARHREAAFRFCQRFGSTANSLDVPVRSQAAEGFTVNAVDLDLVREAQEALAAAKVLSTLHQRRLRSLEAVTQAHRQRFEIGQTSVNELRGAEEALTDARLQESAARSEVALAEGRIAALRGTLGQPAAAAPRACVLAPPLEPSTLPSYPVSEAAPAAMPPPDVPLERAAARLEHAPAAQNPLAGADIRRTRSSALQCMEAGAQPVTKSADGWPAFDWPPPVPTTTANLPPRLVRPARDGGMLDNVADRFYRVLKQLGYPSTFLSVPEGFALLTRMERILEDGSTSSDPWSRELPRVGELGFGDFVRALFRAPPGRYRVIAIVVSNQPYPTGPAVLTAQRFDKLMCSGLNRAPPALVRIPYQEGTTTADALIYEFSKPRNDAAAAFLASTTIPADEHLERAGIYQALRTLD